MLRREAPLHALMLAVMAVAILAGTTSAMLGGAVVLVVAAVGCAAIVRRQPAVSPHLVAQCLDLWAMALAMLALTHPVGASAGVGVGGAAHHGFGAPGWLAYLAVVAAWLLARTGPARARAMLADTRLIPAIVTGAGLAAMPALM